MVSTSLAQTFGPVLSGSPVARLNDGDTMTSQVLGRRGACHQLGGVLALPISKLPGKAGSFQRKVTPLKVSAVLDKSSGMGTSGQSSNEPLDPARAALERLFSQAQRYEERKADPEYTTENELEKAVAQIEVDLTTALNALRHKEEELRVAEEFMQQDRLELQRARAALIQREKQLEAAEIGKTSKHGELETLRSDVRKFALELEQGKLLMTEKEAQVKAAEAGLLKTEEELRKVNALLIDKDDAVAKLLAEVEARKGDFNVAQEKEAQESERVKNLVATVRKQEKELKRTKEEVKGREEKLISTEKDLESKVLAWLAAQEEIRVLELDLENSKSNAGMTKSELDNAKALLADVQQELQASQSAVSKFRTDITSQKEQLGKSDKELDAQRAVLKQQEVELGQARRELQNSREQLRLTKAGYERLTKQVADQKQEIERLQVALTAGKEAVKEAVAEVKSLKKQIRQKDFAISDGELSMRMKEAELVRFKLQIQHLKSDLSVAQVALRDKSLELDLANRQVAGLRAELAQVKSKLKEKEEQLASLHVLLEEKDRIIAAMRIDLTATHVQLTEATSVVEQIAALSKSLAQSAAAGAKHAMEENQVLMQTNYELFAANRTLLERELELQRYQELETEGALQRKAIEGELAAVKSTLREKEAELASVSAAVENKDVEIRQLLTKWEAREGELQKLRQNVMDEAHHLSVLRVQAGEGELVQVPASDSGVDQLELEVAKLEVETALCALRGLADLSKELKEECELGQANASFALQEATRDGAAGETLALPIEAQGAQEKGEEVEAAQIHRLSKLKEQLVEKDVALELAKNAMDNLTRLTHKLVVEAGITVEDFDLDLGEPIAA